MYNLSPRIIDLLKSPSEEDRLLGLLLTGYEGNDVGEFHKFREHLKPFDLWLHVKFFMEVRNLYKPENIDVTKYKVPDERTNSKGD